MSALDEITTEVSGLRAKVQELEDALTVSNARRDTLARENSWLKSQVDNYIAERKAIRAELESARTLAVAADH